MERRRGRRSKVVEYGAEKIVDPLLAEGKTYKEVAEAFEDATGEKIALASVGAAQQPFARGHQKDQAGGSHGG